MYYGSASGQQDLRSMTLPLLSEFSKPTPTPGGRNKKQKVDGAGLPLGSDPAGFPPGSRVSSYKYLNGNKELVISGRVCGTSPRSRTTWASSSTAHAGPSCCPSAPTRTGRRCALAGGRSTTRMLPRPPTSSSSRAAKSSTGRSSQETSSRGWPPRTTRTALPRTRSRHSRALARAQPAGEGADTTGEVEGADAAGSEVATPRGSSSLARRRSRVFRRRP